MAEPATELNANDMEAVANTLIVDEAAPEEEPTQTLDEEDVEAEAPEEDALEEEAEEGDEEDEAEEAEDAGQTEELYTVKVDGSEQEVTLEDLKRSYSGQAYIQKGMQETADSQKRG